MQLNDWHVIELRNSKRREIVYGPIDEWIEEIDPGIGNGYKEIPNDKWTVSEMVEITGNMLEDTNHHDMTDMPDVIERLTEEAGIPERSRETFLRLYMKEMFDRYGY